MQRCEPIKLDEKESSKLNNKTREVNLIKKTRMRLLVDLTMKERERVSKMREREKEMQSKTTI